MKREQDEAYQESLRADRAKVRNDFTHLDGHPELSICSPVYTNCI
jgi:hypothetical protein